MGKRLDLQKLLLDLLGSGNVYYQPPSTTNMQYPAIVYSRDQIKTTYANDSVYSIKIAYEVILIDEDPDSIYIGKIALLPNCRWTKNYTMNNLNHDAFTLYY